MSAKRTFDDAKFDDGDSITVANMDTTQPIAMPLKRFFRSRAHCNPLSHNDGFHYPLSPDTAGGDITG